MSDDEMLIAGLRLRNLDALVERLDDPQTVATLLNLLDVLPTLSGSLQILDGFYLHSEHILDNVRDLLAEVVGMTAGTPEAQAARKLVEIGQQALPAVGAVADSGLVSRLADPDLLDTLGRAASPETIATLAVVLDAVGRARTEATASERRPGVFALMSALRDPDISRGLDFGLRVLKVLGASLAEPTTTTTQTPAGRQG